MGWGFGQKKRGNSVVFTETSPWRVSPRISGFETTRIDCGPQTGDDLEQNTGVEVHLVRGVVAVHGVT